MIRFNEGVNISFECSNVKKILIATETDLILKSKKYEKHKYRTQKRYRTLSTLYENKNKKETTHPKKQEQTVYRSFVIRASYKKINKSKFNTD